MAENSIMLGGEISFFGDRSFTSADKSKPQKDLTKNSSNPEKVFETLNSEIKKFTEQKTLDLSSSNRTIDNSPSEPMFFDNIWKNSTNSTKQDTQQYYKKYELLKKQFKQKEKNDIIKEQAENFDDVPNDECETEEGTIINKINSINIKSNLITHQKQSSSNSVNNNSSGNFSSKHFCNTEPDELYYAPYFSESLPINTSNKTPQQMRTFNPSYLMIQQQLNNNLMSQFASTNTVPNFSPRYLNTKGSFLSTQYSSNKMYMSNDLMDEGEEEEQLNENVDNVNYNSYLNNYRARIPTNSSNESNNSMHYKQLWNEEKKKYSFSFNESNFCNNYSGSLKGSFRSTKSKGKSDLFCNTKNEKQFINVEEIAKGIDTRTTLMIRNIPIKYTDDMLINEMKKFENKYDCLYMPYDFEKGGNKGYAFINFTHPLNILLFYTSFEGKSWTYFESKKICELNFANFQGINEIKKHARNYKGLKKPTFFIITDDLKTNIEVPDKFLNDIKENYPKMKYIEKKQSQTILIKTLT